MRYSPRYVCISYCRYFGAENSIAMFVIVTRKLERIELVRCSHQLIMTVFDLCAHDTVRFIVVC